MQIDDWVDYIWLLFSTSSDPLTLCFVLMLPNDPFSIFVKNFDWLYTVISSTTFSFDNSLQYFDNFWCACQECAKKHCILHGKLAICLKFSWMIFFSCISYRIFFYNSRSLSENTLVTNLLSEHPSRGVGIA